MALQTHRIILRTPIPEDDETLVSLYTNAETMRHLPTLHNQPWDAPRMAARREARAHDELLGRARNFTVLLRSRGGGEPRVIGQAGYRTIWGDETPKRGELGVILTQAQQGRGLAWDVHLLLLTLGFEELGLEVVEWMTGVENQGMRAVLQKMGCKDSEVLEEDQDGDPQSALWRKEAVKYTLHKDDWADCKRWLCEKVDRYSAGSRGGLGHQHHNK
ncbi:hypothetical protein KC19_3G141100 [Ceratodon purpureus]|uniref:N-acetyltransferase domain-containing protein n=1 Tax=Ceratodon purpureus TaxID=3225 RepID=A0A8T0IKW0_CERPU|nr:hypothetical protein KC19_3G141100 [Ceratodon purpureus]